MKSRFQSLFYLGLALLCLSSLAVAADVSFTLSGAGPANLGGVYTSPYTATIAGVSGIKVFCDDFVDDVYIGETWNAQVTKLSDLPLIGPTSPVLWDTNDTASCSGLSGTAQSDCLEKAGYSSGTVPGSLNNTQMSSKQVYDYITVALLAEQALQYNATSLNAELLSYAIWTVFHPNAPASIGSCTFAPGVSCQTQVGNYLTAARTAANGQSASNFSNVLIYTSDPKSAGAVTYCPGGSACNTPQEFIVVQMAESPFSAIFGLDLLGVAGLVFFLRRRFVRITS